MLITEAQQHGLWCAEAHPLEQGRLGKGLGRSDPILAQSCGEGLVGWHKHCCNQCWVTQVCAQVCSLQQRHSITLNTIPPDGLLFVAMPVHSVH